LSPFAARTAGDFMGHFTERTGKVA